MMKNFVPADHDLVVLCQDLFQALIEIRLQVLIVLHAVGVNVFLNLRIRVPLLAVDLVAADVEIGIGKQLGHFGDEFVEELVGLFAGWIEDRIALFERKGAWAACEFGISDDPRAAVARHIKFWNDPNAALVRIGNEIANLGLRVELIVGAHARQFGEDFALGTESLIVGKMPVEDVHFYGGHAVEIALEHIDGNEVAADVDQRATPRETRLVLDRNRGSSETTWRDGDEL